MGVQLLGGIGQGLAQGIQTGQQQAMMKELQDLQKKKLNTDLELEQKRQTMLSQLSPEQQMAAQFPGLAKMDQNDLDKAITKFIGGFMESQGQNPVQASTEQSAGDIEPMVKYASEYHGIPDAIARALVAVESQGFPGATGKSGEIGLTQLMPGTAQEMGVSNPRDPYQNLMGGMGYLAKQKQRFGDWDRALAAYNTGPETVESRGITPEGREYLGKIQSGMRPKGSQQKTFMGLTPEDIVRGYLKKKYGAESDEWSPMKGIAGPGGQPYLVPFNKRTKQFDWSAATPEAVEPKFITQTNALGEEQQIPVNPYDMQAIPTKSGGKSPEQAGKIAVTAGGINALKDAEQIMFDNNGGVNWSNILKANAPMGGIGEGRIIQSKFRQAVRGQLRPESGAMINDQEINDMIVTYLPSAADYALGGDTRDRIAKEKFRDFQMLIENLGQMTNPRDQLQLIKTNRWMTPVEQGPSSGNKRMTYDPSTRTFK